jgi:hypothetical protein
MNPRLDVLFDGDRCFMRGIVPFLAEDFISDTAAAGPAG